jgi:hypothetical protein
MLVIPTPSPIDICADCQDKPIAALAEWMERRGYNRPVQPHGW